MLIASQVMKPTTASGRLREAEEGKVTSEQDWLQPVAVRADNFSGRIPHIKKIRNKSGFLVGLAGFEPAG